jgi:hypothetical protein
MILQPVESSNIQAVGYEPDDQLLAIQFRSGDIYAYSDVPKSIYTDLMGAESKGKYFSRYIRHTYAWEKNPALLLETIRLTVQVHTTVDTVLVGEEAIP